MMKTWVVLASPVALHHGAQRKVVVAQTAQEALDKIIKGFGWQHYEYFMVKLRDDKVWE